MDRDTWRFINTFSGWLSAIGTLVAVAATIYLSRRDKQIRLTVRASKGFVVRPGGAPVIDVIWIAVRNIGIRSAQGSNIYWKMGVWKPSTLLQTPSGDPASSEIPIRLADGETTDYAFPIEQYWSTNGARFRELVRARWSRWLTLRSMKVCVSTTAGKSIGARIDHTLRDYLAEKLAAPSDPPSVRR